MFYHSKGFDILGLQPSQYQAIMRIYEKRQFVSHDIQTSRYQEVIRKVPEYKHVEDEISSVSVQYGRRLLSGEESSTASLHATLDSLSKQKERLLTAGGFPEDYLEPVYVCKDCKDTGYIGNQPCHCLKKMMIETLYQQSNLTSVLTQENFSTFNLNYYSDSFIDPKTNRSSRAIMLDARKTCQGFVTDFSGSSPNLLLYGDVGIGKSFLTHCIA